MKKNYLLLAISLCLISTLVAQTIDSSEFSALKAWKRNYLSLSYFQEKIGLYEKQPPGSFAVSGSDFLTYLRGVQFEVSHNYYLVYNQKAGIFLKGNLFSLGFFNGVAKGILIGIPSPGLGFNLQLGEEASFQPFLDYRFFFISSPGLPGLSRGFLPGARLTIGKMFLSMAYASTKEIVRENEKDVTYRLKHFNFGLGFRF